MPEALGGGYPVQAGIIKDENRSIVPGEKTKAIFHPKGDQFKEKPTPDVEKKTEASHVEQAKDEVQIAIMKAKPLLEEAVAQAKPHLLQAMAHVKAAGEQGKPFLDQTVTEVKKIAAGYMEQVAGEFSGTTTTTGEKDTLEKVKTQAKEAVKAHLEQTDSEKSGEPKVQGKEAQASDKPLLERAKIAYRENMPEILGGRPASIPEVVKAGLEREVRAEKEYKEAKAFEELPPEQQSMTDKVKHGYKETMPSVLGGRPKAVSEVVDNLKKDVHEEVDNLKSSYEQGNLEEHVKERAKEVIEEHMPESLGGRPPTFGEKVKKEIGKAVVKNRVNALIKGTKEEIENRS